MYDVGSNVGGKGPRAAESWFATPGIFRTKTANKDSMGKTQCNTLINERPSATFGDAFLVSATTVSACCHGSGARMSQVFKALAEFEEVCLRFLSDSCVVRLGHGPDSSRSW